eukprot:GDKK01029049.1.p1 GENE.GDKK01029049.1~~GDKK01029049.1.p1  ORF type:complete len:236 (+),score=63.58 GDKK01029049.1:77-784(+)
MSTLSSAIKPKILPQPLSAKSSSFSAAAPLTRPPSPRPQRLLQSHSKAKIEAEPQLDGNKRKLASSLLTTTTTFGGNKNNSTDFASPLRRSLLPPIVNPETPAQEMSPSSSLQVALSQLPPIPPTTLSSSSSLKEQIDGDILTSSAAQAREFRHSSTPIQEKERSSLKRKDVELFPSSFRASLLTNNNNNNNKSSSRSDRKRKKKNNLTTPAFLSPPERDVDSWIKKKMNLFVSL